MVLNHASNKGAYLSDTESFARGAPTLTMFFFLFVTEERIKIALKTDHLWPASETPLVGECSGSVVECLNRDRRAAGTSLTGVTVVCP